MSYVLVLAPPTLNTVTATHTIQPTIIVVENAYKVKRLLKLYYLFSVNIMNVIGNVILITLYKNLTENKK